MIRDLSAAANPSSPAGSEYLKDLIVVLTQKEIKVRYKNTWLGYVWSVLHPLAFALVYFVAFGVFMQVQIKNYPLFLIAGLFPWQWINYSVGAAPNIFLANASLLKKVCFARHVLVAATVLSNGFHFVLSIPVILVFLAVYHLTPTWLWIPGVPLLIVAQFLTTYGLSLAVASLNLFLRDLDRLTTLFLTFLFFLTPITYTSSMIPEKYQPLMYLNPFTPLILSWQELFLTGTLNGGGIAAAGAMAVLSATGGYVIYSNLAPRFAEVV